MGFPCQNGPTPAAPVPLAVYIQPSYPFAGTDCFGV
jgi:hypothetical protein